MAGTALESIGYGITNLGQVQMRYCLGCRNESFSRLLPNKITAKIAAGFARHAGQTKCQQQMFHLMLAGL